MAIAHNLMVLYRNRLEGGTGVGDGAEDTRREARSGAMERAAKEAGRAASSLVLALRGTTQCSVKLVRWLCHALRHGLTEEAAVPRLANLMSTS